MVGKVNAMENNTIPYITHTWGAKKSHPASERCPDCISCPGTFPHSLRNCALCRPVTENVHEDNPAVKFDDDKLRYDLIPAEALKELVAVYTMGAKKYAPRNWEKGMSWGRVFAATMRHAWAFWSGETYDNESGLHHMAHAAFGCLALITYSQKGKGHDDRWDTNTPD